MKTLNEAWADFENAPRRVSVPYETFKAGWEAHAAQKAIFINGATGDDVTGDGTADKPFRTIGQALSSSKEPQAAETVATRRLIGVGRMMRIDDEGRLALVIACGRCHGIGYHHGFGEQGYDPDWCERCGGSMYDYQDVVTPWET